MPSCCFRLRAAFRVVTVNVYGQPSVCAGRYCFFSRFHVVAVRCFEASTIGQWLTACQDHFFFETSRVPCFGRDIAWDRLVGEAGVDVGPHFVGVATMLPFYNNFGGSALVPVFWGFESRTCCRNVEAKNHDSRHSDLNFDVSVTVCRRRLQFRKSLIWREAFAYVDCCFRPALSQNA